MFVNIFSFECRGKQLVKQIKKFSSAWTFYIHMYVSHSMQLDSHSWTSNVGQQRYARWKFFFFLKSWNINMSVVYFTLHLDSHCRPQNELSSDRPPLSVLIVKYRAPDTAFLLVPMNGDGVRFLVLSHRARICQIINQKMVAKTNK